MNELPNDVQDMELRAELQAIRKQLQYLEAKQAAAESGNLLTARWRVPKKLMISSLAFVALMAAGGLLRSQGTAIQALFIDKAGNVLIGGDLKVTKEAIVNAFSAGSATVTKSLTVGTQAEPAPVIVAGNLTAGRTTVSSLTVGTEAKPAGAIAAGSLTAESANLSSLTVNTLSAPNNGDLTIDGNTKTTGTINGARQPVQFSISGSTQQKDIDIKQYCDAAPKYGCEIRLLMFTKNNDVNAVTAQIYYGGGDLYTIASQGKGGKWRLDRPGQNVLDLQHWIKADVTPNGMVSFKNDSNISTTIIIIYDLQTPKVMP